MHFTKGLNKYGHLACKNLVILFLFLQTVRTEAQSAWPAESWSAAVNITSIMDPAGLTELSGLFWNATTNRLYVSHGDGRLRVLQLNTTTNVFSQVGNIAHSSGPEGITQANLTANEYYTIDEDNYQIRKYTYASNFSSDTLVKSWNILLAPSPMTNTGNTGPEGIAFIPDSFLTAVGFISQATGSVYHSVKGMGGLIFIAHQNQGYIWVFDVNPNVNNDFAYVGKYKTNRTESCDLAFDRGTGLLYILHNTGVNTLEVTDLTTSLLAGNERKFTVTKEYALSNPSGSNINVEGFAITSKCADSTNVSAWLCRDVEAGETAATKQDCIRWFNPFTAPGTCKNTSPVTLNLKIFIQGFYAGNRQMRAVLHDNNLNADVTACDSIVVELHAATTPHGLVESKKVLLHKNGSAVISFSSFVYNQSYYIAVKPKRAVEVWSKNAVLFNSLSPTFDFSSK